MSEKESLSVRECIFEHQKSRQHIYAHFACVTLQHNIGILLWKNSWLHYSRAGSASACELRRTGWHSFLLTTFFPLFITLQWQIQEFPEEAPIPQSGCGNLLIYCKFFAKTAGKWKNLDLKEACIPGAPFGSTGAVTHKFSRKYYIIC